MIQPVKNNIEKHEEGLYEKENETTTEVEAPLEAADMTEDDRITSITINPAFNMKHKDGSDVELDLSKIKIKAKEIYDEEPHTHVYGTEWKSNETTHWKECECGDKTE